MYGKDAVLFSIKPEYVRKMESGEKKYEFRKAIFSGINPPIQTTYIKGTPTYQKDPKAAPILIYLYESVPTKAITGYFYCEEVISNSPQKLWELFSEDAGICQEDFFKYFKKARYNDVQYQLGHALKISDYSKLSSSIPLSEINILRAPQNFQYLAHYQIAGMEPLNGKYGVWEDMGYMSSWADPIEAYKECDRLHDIDGRHYFVKHNPV
jgi:predicted transcriptional regulator